MARNRVFNALCTTSLLNILILLKISFVNTITPYISYCDNGNKLTKISIDDYSCSHGLNFGSQSPSCFCVLGIYKVHTTFCKDNDGWAPTEICMHPYKTADSKSQDPIVSSMEIAKLTSDFDWKAPGALYESDPKGVWSYSASSQPVAAKGSYFYAMNGKPYWLSRNNFCISNQKREFSVCKYTLQENKHIWINKPFHISVYADCSSGTPLAGEECFNFIPKDSSECSLPCSNNPSKGSGNATSRNPRPKQGDPLKRNKTVTLRKEDFDKNCTDPNDYRNHDNRFLNRKMLLYNVVNQLDMRNSSEGTILETMEPNKTLRLFDFMKNITKKKCVSKYVNPGWIDQIVDLFYILHKGNVFRYEEQLNPDQYQWILDILTSCETNATEIPLFEASGEGLGECAGGNSGLAAGYCKNLELSTCDRVEVTVDTTGEDSHRQKHYVPEVAWNIVDLVHAACFPQFNDSYRMFHVVEQALEKLFTLQIKNLWHHPGWMDKTKTKLLGYAADNYMHNFEVCVQAAYGVRNDELPRLVRPFSPVYLRKKRESFHEKSGKTFIKRPRKFNKNPKNGGGQAGIECAKTDEDLNMPYC